MDVIFDRAKNILILDERSQEEKIKDAKIGLEKLFKSYGLTREDLKKTRVVKRKFLVHTKSEKIIFFHCLLKMFGRKNDITINISINKYNIIIYANMTEIEYHKFTPFFYFHLHNYRKERKKLLKNIAITYINKHNLFAEEDNRYK